MDDKTNPGHKIARTLTQEREAKALELKDYYTHQILAHEALQASGTYQAPLYASYSIFED